MEKKEILEFIKNHINGIEEKRDEKMTESYGVKLEESKDENGDLDGLKIVPHDSRYEKKTFYHTEYIALAEAVGASCYIECHDGVINVRIY